MHEHTLYSNMVQQQPVYTIHNSTTCQKLQLWISDKLQKFNFKTLLSYL